MEKATIESDSLVLDNRAHPPRLNTRKRPIVNQYREGKVKSTSFRGVKKFLKPYAYKRSELLRK